MDKRTHYLHYRAIKSKLQPLPISQLNLVMGPGSFRGEDNWTWTAPSRTHYNLWICLSGSARMRCGQSTYRVHAGTAFVLPPNLKVYGYGVPKGGYIRNFMAHWTPINGEIWTPDPYALLGIQIQEIDVAMGLIQSILRHSAFQDELSRQQSEWGLLQLLSLLWRQSQQPHQNRSKVHLAIYRQIEQMRSGEILFTPVEELAEQARASKMHYTRTFQKLTGETPNRFQIRQRMERACILLQETSDTLESIALEIGYTDVYFFSRQFKKEFKMSAASYRKILR